MHTSSSTGTKKPCSGPRAICGTIRRPTRHFGSVPPARPSPERWTKPKGSPPASSRSIRRSASRGSKTTSALTSRTSSWKSTSWACALRDCPNERAASPCRHRWWSDDAVACSTKFLMRQATSGNGPSRHFAPPHGFGRKRDIAEVEGQPSVAKGDARDPESDVPRRYSNRVQITKAVLYQPPVGEYIQLMRHVALFLSIVSDEFRSYRE